MTMLLRLVQRPLLLLTLLFVLSSHVREVAAEFGDTVSSPADQNPVCPVYATCPAICIADLSNCPTPDCPAGKILCPSGHCHETCTGQGHEKNPCEHECAPFACPKVDLRYEDCRNQFEDFYQEAEKCAEETKQTMAQYKVSPSGMNFLLAWIVLVTIAIVLYCQANRCFSTTQRYEMEEGQFQTGFQTHIIGTLMYYWTIATVWGFQLVLLILIIIYYVNQATTTAVESQWYADEEQVLFTFEVVWVVGFFWSFIMKWPDSLRSIFWKRCSLRDATVVAVWTKKTVDHGQVHFSSPMVAAVRQSLKNVGVFLNGIMVLFFGVDADSDGSWAYCPVITDVDGSKHFVHNFRRYNFDSDQFVPSGWALDKVDKQGLTAADVHIRRKVCGPNIIPMDKPTILKILVEEFTQPYYTYQNFIMWSWVPLWYYYMAIVQSAVIIIGGITVVLFRLRNENSLYKLTHVEGHVQVLRDGKYETISPADLVPGDIIMVEPGLSYCDCVLVTSTGVLVDESALTGEANPIAKTAVEDLSEITSGDTMSAKRHTIQAGCTVLESEPGHNLAVVTHTASYTTKGELLRNIFSYQRHPFKFDVEVAIVIMILVCYGFIGFCIVFFNLSYSPVYGWFYGIYAVSSIMPPLLPTVFTVSVGVSDNRLLEHRIACTNSEEILVAGKVRMAYFDKTGTLTKQGLEFISARCGKSWEKDVPGLSHISEEMSLGIASCHSLSRARNGEFIGNPVDRTMFAAIGADIMQPSIDSNVVIVREANGNQAEVVKHFDFDHHRMTQSVIVKSRGKLFAFVKGSGESMTPLCSNSSLPAGFADSLRASAKAGIYQITMAVKELDSNLSAAQVQEMNRDEIEFAQNLSFLGVINFKNVLREETPFVIRELEHGEVKCVMITGDSVLTGIKIAKEAGIFAEGSQVLYAIDSDDDGKPIWRDDNDNPVISSMMPGSLAGENTQLAIAGSVWSKFCISDPKLADEFAEHIRVYGRCTPMDKVSVVTQGVDRGYITLMCGDGGNDCGALKTAHVGVALSDAEASIVAPFTSLDKTITSVLDVLKEGRCALASALSSYKFMIMYGQLVFSTDISNSAFHIMLPEWCWVFIDGIWSIGLGFTLPLSKPSGDFAPSRPTSSLLGAHTMFSTIGVLVIHYIFYFITLKFLFSQDWYQCREWTGDDISNTLWIGDNYETETMFLVVGFQFISTAITYNFGYEWRSNWFSNRSFVIFTVAITALHFYILLVPGYLSCLFRVNCDNDYIVYSVSQWEIVPIQNHWNTTMMPEDYRFGVMCIIIANTFAVVAWDYFAVNGMRKHLGNKKRMEEFAGKYRSPPLHLDEEDEGKVV